MPYIDRYSILIILINIFGINVLTFMLVYEMRKVFPILDTLFIIHALLILLISLQTIYICITTLLNDTNYWIERWIEDA